MRVMPTTVLRVAVKPRSRVSELTPTEDGGWLARVKAPPVDGKANAELIELVARQFGVRQADVTIAAGARGRIKRVRVQR